MTEKDAAETQRTPGEEGSDLFDEQLRATLQHTQDEVARLTANFDAISLRSWETARERTEEFKPVPWFIWRISNFVLNKPGEVNKLSDGLLYGMKKMLYAAASDRVLGTGEPVTVVHRALEILSSDVIAAVYVINAVCRRLQTREFARIWGPILEDAILRAHIGYFVGQMNPAFGPGRGMLAGFAGRCGLAVLIATGTLDQARRALELLATGAPIKEVGMRIYSCDPLQISAMTLTAAGCGKDAAFGTVGYASLDPFGVVKNEEQKRWLASFAITEAVRAGSMRSVDPRCWDILGFTTPQDRVDLEELVKMLLRRGHGWEWLMTPA